MIKKTLISLAKTILPKSIKDYLFHFAFNVNHSEFEYFAYKYANAPNMKFALLAIKNLEFHPEKILDIGAYHGDWARMAHDVWPEASLIMIEGNEEKRSILEVVANDLQADLKINLLGASDGEQVEFIVMESGSSVFEEESPVERKKQKKTLTTLDSLLEGENVDFIKIDTQGYELEVFRGGIKTLAKAQAVLMEVSLIEINKGAPLIEEVLTFMKMQGFVSYDIVEIHRRPLDGATNQIDILFVRHDSFLIANKAHYEE
ncbi:MAG: FkbM family methyltransferase [Emcibacteraceae bacterium]